MSRRHQHDDEDEDEVRAKEELAANMVAPQVVPGDKVATAPVSYTHLTLPTKA